MTGGESGIYSLPLPGSMKRKEEMESQSLVAQREGTMGGRSVFGFPFDRSLLPHRASANFQSDISINSLHFIQSLHDATHNESQEPNNSSSVCFILCSVCPFVQIC